MVLPGLMGRQLVAFGVAAQPLLDQIVRDAIDAGVELRVGQTLPAPDQRLVVRQGLGDGTEHRRKVEADVAAHGRSSGWPRLERVLVCHERRGTPLVVLHLPGPPQADSSKPAVASWFCRCQAHSRRRAIYLSRDAQLRANTIAARRKATLGDSARRHDRFFAARRAGTDGPYRRRPVAPRRLLTRHPLPTGGHHGRTQRRCVPFPSASQSMSPSHRSPKFGPSLLRPWDFRVGRNWRIFLTSAPDVDPVTKPNPSSSLDFAYPYRYPAIDDILTKRRQTNCAVVQPHWPQH